MFVRIFNGLILVFFLIFALHSSPCSLSESVCERLGARAVSSMCDSLCVCVQTDARCLSMDEAIARCLEFKAAGCDITFLEAPESVEEMER